MDSGRGNLRWRRRAPLGCAREREQRARERAESEGEERGGRGEVRGIHSRVGEAAGRRCRRGVRGGVAVSLLCLLAEVGDDWHQDSGLGRAGPPGKCPVLSLPPFYFLFSNYFDLF